jgi:hypothetical protein
MPDPVIGHFFARGPVGAAARCDFLILKHEHQKIAASLHSTAPTGFMVAAPSPDTKKPPNTSLSGGFWFAAKTAYFFKP